MTATNNLFMRDNLAGDGTVPQSGGLSSSPDIIPKGLVPVSDFQQVFSSAASYAADDGVNITAGETNYLYVRAKNNFSGGGATGTVNLYWAESSLLLNPPYTLIGSAPISAQQTGEIVVAGAPIQWQDPQQLTGGHHYCLIAQLVTTTPDDPNPIPGTFDSSTAYRNWLANTPQIAQRNVQVVDTGAGSLSYSYAYSNPNPQTQKYVFTVTCNGFPTGVPVGMTSPQVGLDASGTTDGNATWTLPSDPIEVSSGLQGTLVVTMDFTGKTIPANASYSVSYYESNVDPMAFAGGTIRAETLGVAPASAGELAQMGSCHVIFRSGGGSS